MSEIKKIATRDSYGNTLVELGKEHDNLVVLDADLAGATKTGVFIQVRHPGIHGTKTAGRSSDTDRGYPDWPFPHG